MRINSFDGSVTVEQRDAGKLPVIRGYASVFYDGTERTEYRLGECRERVMPGAFDDAIKGKDVRGLFNHDKNAVLGRRGAGTLQLSVDERGLHYSIDPPPTTTAADVVELVRRGDVTGSSMSFTVEHRGESWSDDGRIRSILQVGMLLDVGPVTFPAYDGATAIVRADEVTEDELIASRAAWLRWAKSDGRRAKGADRYRARVRAIELDALEADRRS